ncbi:MAG: LptF/LptG family permease [bacterium]|nr:LptF/LptG family permease [bacterium]
MKIIDRYVLKQYGQAFFFALSCFALVVLISQFFDKIDTFLNYKTPPYKIIIYLFYRLPFWLVQVMPIATLLATLFSLSNMLRHNELTAMKASGLSLYRLLLPLFLFTAILSGLTFIFNETLASPLEYKAKLYEKHKIRHEEGLDYLMRNNVIYFGQDDRIYNIRFFDGQNNTMQDVQIDEFSKNRILVKQLVAKLGQWKDNHWIFTDGIIREFDQQGQNIIREEKFDLINPVLPETPSDFQREAKKSTEMNYRELKNYIIRLRKNGIPANKEQVELGLKFSYPFANMIILLVGIPFALWTKQASKVMNFGTGMGIAFIFWGTIEVGHALGENKVLTPLLAAWLSNIIFGSIGVWLLTKKVRK